MLFRFVGVIPGAFHHSTSCQSAESLGLKKLAPTLNQPFPISFSDFMTRVSSSDENLLRTILFCEQLNRKQDMITEKSSKLFIIIMIVGLVNVGCAKKSWVVIDVR